MGRSFRWPRRTVQAGSWPSQARGKENVVRPDDRLREILEANKALFTVYVLKADLKHFWDFRWRLHTGLLKGINNTIKVIKRRAYGFLDDDYFFPKIRVAFPGIGR